VSFRQRCKNYEGFVTAGEAPPCLVQSATDAIDVLLERRPEHGLLVIVDKLTLLDSMAAGAGCPNVSSVKTLRQLQSLCATKRADLTVAVAANRPSAAAAVAHSSDLYLRTWPLTTGRSSSVSGNLSYAWPLFGREGQWQFKVEERSVKLFAAGASEAVL